MGFLVGYTIASMVGALFVVRIFDYIVSGIADGMHNTAKGGLKVGLFVGTWTAITAGQGMRDFTSRVRRLRQMNREVSSLLDAPSKEKGR